MCCSNSCCFYPSLSLSYEYSHADALSRLVQQFNGWLPAHLVCVLLIVLRNQLDKFQEVGSFRSLKPYIGYLQYTSLYLVTGKLHFLLAHVHHLIQYYLLHLGCRLLKKLILNLKFLPEPEPLDYSINISIIIHCTAIGLSIVIALVIWLILACYGNVLQRLATRLTRLSASGSNIMLSIITHLPITYGILTVSVALGTCSGVGLLLAFVFYFMMLSNAYKDYLEDFLWQKAANLLKKVRKKANGTAAAAETARGEGEVETAEEQSLTKPIEDAAREEAHVEELEQQELDQELCVGLQNFPFHVTLLLLLFVQLLLNGSATLAWLRSRR